MVRESRRPGKKDHGNQLHARRQKIALIPKINPKRPRIFFAGAFYLVRGSSLFTQRSRTSLRGRNHSLVYPPSCARTESSSLCRHGEIRVNKSRVAPAMSSTLDTPLSRAASQIFLTTSAPFSRTILPR